MSKRIKGLIEKEIKNRLGTVESVGVLNPRGITALKTNGIRRRLREKGLRMLVVNNNLARRAATGTKLSGFDSLLDGPSAVVFGEQSASAIARLLLAEKKTDDKIELRGIFFDGEAYAGEEGVTTVSKMPTREEAIANIVALFLSPAKQLAGALKSPASTIAGILKTIEERGDKGAAEEAPAPAAA